MLRTVQKHLLAWMGPNHLSFGESLDRNVSQRSPTQITRQKDLRSPDTNLKAMISGWWFPDKALEVSLERLRKWLQRDTV